MQLIKFQQTRSDLHRRKLKSLFGDFFFLLTCMLPCFVLVKSPPFKSWTKLADPNRFSSFSAPTGDKHLFLPDKQGAKSADPAGPHQRASASVFTCGSRSPCTGWISEEKGDACHWGKYKAILIYQEFPMVYSLKSKHVFFFFSKGP